MLGGILARGMDALPAPFWAFYVHAEAGKALRRRAGISFLARELRAGVPLRMKKI
ncbi:MAG: hypothetical protein DLM50_07980 [Candidatus Meridianibacter frigidus]|nr:MAG: hypothetical protein DLM50_07980 [Candidatus Eremiobacteraeota bacterium]